MGSFSWGWSSKHEERTLQFAETSRGFREEVHDIPDQVGKECVRNVGGRRKLEMHRQNRSSICGTQTSRKASFLVQKKLTARRW
jgi:hypothetical protein